MYLNLKYCTLTMTKNTLLESNSTLNIRGGKKKLSKLSEICWAVPVLTPVGCELQGGFSLQPCSSRSMHFPVLYMKSLLFQTIPKVPGHYKHHFRNNETLMTFYLGKIQLQRKDSVDIKCKQLTHTCQEQHHSYTTQCPHCVLYLKSGIKKIKDSD